MSAVATAVSARKAAKAQSRATSLEAEANEVQSANQSIESAEARRDAVQRRRFVRAQIQQGAASDGVAGSSGELGAISALTTSMSGEIGEQKRNILATQGINDLRQRAANYRAEAERAGIFGSLSSRVFSVASPRAFGA